MENNATEVPELELKECTVSLHDILTLTSSLLVLQLKGLDSIHTFKKGEEEGQFVFLTMRPKDDNSVIQIEALWKDAFTQKTGSCKLYFFQECKKAIVVRLDKPV